MPRATRQDRQALTTGAVVFARTPAMLGVVAIFVAVHADTRKVGAPAGGVQVALSEFAISPSSISAPSNGTLVITNNGSAVHNFHVDGTDLHTADIAPGGSATLKLDGVKAG